MKLNKKNPYNGQKIETKKNKNKKTVIITISGLVIVCTVFGVGLLNKINSDVNTNISETTTKITVNDISQTTLSEITVDTIVPVESISLVETDESINTLLPIIEITETTTNQSESLSEDDFVTTKLVEEINTVKPNVETTKDTSVTTKKTVSSKDATTTITTKASKKTTKSSKETTSELIIESSQNPVTSVSTSVSTDIITNPVTITVPSEIITTIETEVITSDISTVVPVETTSLTTVTLPETTNATTVSTETTSTSLTTTEVTTTTTVPTDTTVVSTTTPTETTTETKITTIVTTIDSDISLTGPTDENGQLDIGGGGQEVITFEFLSSEIYDDSGIVVLSTRDKIEYLKNVRNKLNQYRSNNFIKIKTK